ncbi:hypothetical protein DIPPA_18322 [Diplonema papillatum]|nr:hypothetical protein DIPPA_18322 [Diplonema papillatum]|eukprot:gene23016-35267_t
MKRKRDLAAEVDGVFGGGGGNPDAELLKQCCALERRLRVRLREKTEHVKEALSGSRPHERAQLYVSAAYRKDKTACQVGACLVTPSGERLPLNRFVSSMEVLVQDAHLTWSNAALGPPQASGAVFIKQVNPMGPFPATADVRLHFSNERPAAPGQPTPALKYHLNLVSPAFREVLHSAYGVEAAATEGWGCSTRPALLKALFSYLEDRGLTRNGGTAVALDAALSVEFDGSPGAVVPIAVVTSGLLAKACSPSAFAVRVPVPGEIVVETPCAVVKESPGGAELLSHWDGMANADRLSALDQELEDIVARAEAARRRRDLFLLFSRSPQAALREVVDTHYADVAGFHSPLAPGGPQLNDRDREVIRHLATRQC